MSPQAIRVALLTGGQDRSYAVGLSESLLAQGVHLEFIGSDHVNAQELLDHENFRFLNLRGNQDESANIVQKTFRILVYYFRLIAYGVSAQPRLFHILWNNKIEFFDRTFLMLFYRLCGRRILLTAHNVNAAARDGKDSILNRLSLRIQYKLCDHIFVHTKQMAEDIARMFELNQSNITVINFGINGTIPKSGISEMEARLRLNLDQDARIVLFFGQIAPYKGLEYLVKAIECLNRQGESFFLLIAGKVKNGSEKYWTMIKLQLQYLMEKESASLHIGHIPDENVEMYFLAADALVLPYAEIFQSGLPFLSYNFGLPVIATDVGGLRDTVAIGETGIVCAPRDSGALECALRCFFTSELYRDGVQTRKRIQAFAKKRYSWESAAAATRAVYASLLGISTRP